MLQLFHQQLLLKSENLASDAAVSVTPVNAVVFYSPVLRIGRYNDIFRLQEAKHSRATQKSLAEFD